MLNHSILDAAHIGDWATVLAYLESNSSSIDFKARNIAHPEGLRLFDYAEAAHPFYVTTLWQYGARPSYDIKVFRFAMHGNWPDVFNLLERGLVDVNLENDWHQDRWTLMSYAVNQKLPEIINTLQFWGAKRVHLSHFEEQQLHSPIPLRPVYSPQFQAKLQNERVVHQPKSSSQKENLEAKAQSIKNCN